MLPIEIKADFLKTVWLTDYQGVEAIRSSVYRVISALTVASFALSSFLLKDVQHVPNGISMVAISGVTDFAIVCFTWGVFLVLKRDLHNRRKCLVLRQNLLETLNLDTTGTFNVFADATDVQTDIKDDDLYWIPVAGTLAILVKALLVWRLYQT